MTLELKHLHCERDDRVLFRDISQCVERGEILRVAGPNGAGKTTLLRMIAGLFEADGEVLWESAPLSAMPESVLYIGHAPQVTRELTVQANLQFLSGATLEAVRHALQAVGLRGYDDSLVRELSQGQKRRVALARLWLESRPLWILDEPYTALDVEMVAVLDQRIKQHIQAQGVCLLTTHQPSQQLDYRTLELGHGH